MSEETRYAQAMELYGLPLMELLFRAQSVHREHHGAGKVQRCALLSIKTGGCPENCGYCAQSAHHSTGTAREPLLSVTEVAAAARRARDAGAERFCMGAAWRQAPEGQPFERLLEMVRAVKALGLEACMTLGMLTDSQASRLKAAGLDAYNHNLDTSRAHYPLVVTTRTYEDRLQTLHAARTAGLSLCCGGILGLGESVADRCALVAELASLNPQPESVPINLLVSVQGTPLADSSPVPVEDLVRVIAVTRLLIPRARIRLAAGRRTLSTEGQLLAFFAGANSVFVGDRLLTTPNTEADADAALFQALQGEALGKHA